MEQDPESGADAFMICGASHTDGCIEGLSKTWTSSEMVGFLCELCSLFENTEDSQYGTAQRRCYGVEILKQIRVEFLSVPKAYHVS